MLSSSRISKAALLAAAVGLVGVMGSPSRADVFTYTNATGTAQWSTGTHWSSSPNPPTSASNTTLAYSGALASTNVEVSNNDLAGNFQLNQMTVQTSGPTSGTAPTLTISGNPLEFLNDTTDISNPIAPSLSFNVTVGNRTPVVTVSNNIVLTNTLTLSNSTAAIPTVSGVISSSGGLTMAGTGTILLSNTASTYTGPTTLNGGTLRIAALGGVSTPSSIGQGTGSAADIVFGGGALQYTGTTAVSTDRLLTLGDSNGNSGTLDASGTSSGAFNWTNTGSVAFGTSGAHTMSFAGSFTTASSFAPVISDQDATTGKTSVTKTGAGAWSLAGANTYSGGTTISGGTLQSTVAEGFGSGLVTVNSGTASAAGATYSNDWNLGGGAIRVGATTLSGTITLAADSQILYPTSNGSGAITGQITGNHGVTFVGTGGVTATITLSNPLNDYTGDTAFPLSTTSGSDSVLILGASEVIPNGPGHGNLFLAATSEQGSVIVQLNGNTETINGLASNVPGAIGNTGLAGAANVATVQRIQNSSANAGTLIVGDNDASATFIGGLTDGAGGGKLNLTKKGSGTQVLSGGSTHTGATTITGGTLAIDYAIFATSQTNNPVNYFSSTSDMTMAGGTTFAIKGRGDGAATSQANVAFSAARSILLPNAQASQLVVGQVLNLSNVTGTGTIASAPIFITAIDAPGATNTNVWISKRGGSNGSNLQATVSTDATDGTTSQTLKSLTLSGAAGENATIDFGTSGNVLLRIAAAPVQVNDGSTLTIANWDGTAGQGGGTNQLVFTGSPSDFSNVFSQSEVNFSGYGPGYDLIDMGGSYEVVAAAGTAVPEPASLALLGLGAAGLLARRRRIV